MSERDDPEYNVVINIHLQGDIKLSKYGVAIRLDMHTKIWHSSVY